MNAEQLKQKIESEQTEAQKLIETGRAGSLQDFKKNMMKTGRRPGKVGRKRKKGSKMKKDRKKPGKTHNNLSSRENASKVQRQSKIRQRMGQRINKRGG